jgi:hypothetical protein
VAVLSCCEFNHITPSAVAVVCKVGTEMLLWNKFIEVALYIIINYKFKILLILINNNNKYLKRMIKCEKNMFFFLNLHKFKHQVCSLRRTLHAILQL